ncbi:MAG TPA: DUF3592 domain-containing protein [Terracidiphilus sp.]
MIARLIARFFVGILYAAGPVLLLIAIGTSIPTARFVGAAVAADGKIISLNRVYLPRRSKEVYLPVFRFTASDGHTHMLMADSNVSLVPFKPGDKVRILYLKDRPESARIDTVAQLWMPQLILGVIGAIFTGISVRILLRPRSPRLFATVG